MLTVDSLPLTSLSASQKNHGVMRRADISHVEWEKLPSEEQFKIEHQEHAITEKKIALLDGKIESMVKAIKKFDLYHSGAFMSCVRRVIGT